MPPASVRSSGDGPDDLLDAVGPALSQLRRGVLLSVPNPPSQKDMTRTLVLNIVQSEPGEITVGVIAERLGVDPSVASRMVTECLTAGYLTRVPSQSDGRRMLLRLTAAGRRTMTAFSRAQRQAFAHITRDWSEKDRREFARLLVKYVDSMAALKDQ